MRTHPLRPHTALAIACLLAVLLFLVGIAVPQAHFWGSFLLPIVLVFLWGRQRDIYLVTALASLLVIATFWTDGGTTLGDFVTYHLLPLVILWGAAWLLAQRQQLQEQLARSKQELEDRVTARTAELQTSERRYRLLAENAGDLIWTVDMDGNMTYTSPAAQRVRGVTREEEQSASWIDRMPPDIAAQAAAALEADLAALRAGDPVDATPRPAPTYRKDGTLMWTETVMSPIYDDSGRPLGLCGSTRDITERKRLEARAERLEALVDAARDAVMSADLDGTIVTLNRSAEELYGTPAAAVVGRTMAALTPPEYVEPLAEMVGRVASGEAMVIDDVAWRLPDGSTRTLAISLSPIRDSRGKVTAFTSIARDVTDRKQLEDVTNRLAAIVESSPDAIAATDLQGRVVSWNPSAERLYECSASQAIGRPINEILPPSPDTDEAAIVAEVYSGATVPVADRSWTKADGTRVDLSVILSPIKDKLGAVTGMASIARNISERKAAERALLDSEERFNRLFKSSPVAMIFSRLADRVCEEVNDAFVALTGYSREEWIGRTPSELGLLQSKEHVQLRAEMQEHGAIHQRDYIIHTKGGATRDVLFSSELMDFSGETSVLSSVLDITERKAAERTRLFLSALVASSPEAVVGRTVDGTILSWNRGAEQLFGYTAAEAIGQNLTMLAAPGSMEQMVEVMAEVARGSAVEGVETQRITKDGRIFDCHISSFPVRDGGGAIIGVASFTHDISAHKAAEQALRASEERSARLFYASPVGISLTRLADGLYQEVNDAFLALIGCSRAEVIGRTSLELGIISSEDRRRLTAELQVQGSLHGTDLVLHTKRGELLNTLFSIELVDVEGESYLLSSVVDITRRRQLEEALATSERKYRDLYDNSPDMYFVGVPAQGLILDCNQTLARTLGYTPEELIGGPSSVLYAPATYAQLQADRDELMATGKYRNDAAQLRRLDGTLLDVIMAVTLENDPTGGPAQARVTLHDITERKRLEVELRHSEQKWRSVFEFLPVGLSVVDGKDKVTDGNPALAQILGITPEGILEGRYAQRRYFHADMRPMAVDEFPSQRALREGQVVRDVVMGVEKEDGELTWVSVSATPESIEGLALTATVDITALKRAEAERLAVAERWKMAAHISSIGVWDWHANNGEVMWDERMYQLHGLAPGTAMNFALWRTVIHPDDRAAVEANSRRSGLERTWIPVEYRVVLPDGSLRHLLSIGGGLYDEAGTPVRQLGVSMDITARKQMEAALVASERKYRDLYDNSPDMYLSGYSDGTFRDCNFTAAHKLGYTPEELMGLPTSTIYTPTSYSRIVAELPKHIAVGRWDNFEVQLQCKDGTGLDALLSAQFEAATADHLAYSRVTLHDITERRRAEDQLRASEEKFARFFAGNPAAMCVTRRADDVYLEVNAAYLDLTGYTRDELIGRAYTTLGVFPAGYRADLHAVMLAEGRVHNVETQITGKSGTPIDSLVSVETIEVDGTPCSLTMIVDITERKRVQVALAASEARLRAVIENTDDTVWSVDRNYCFLVGNSVFAHGVQRVIGRPLAAGECVIAKPFPDSARALWQPLYDRALAGESFTVQIPSSLSPGGTLACHLHPIYAADGSISGVSGRAADITALKQAEAQLRTAYQRLQLATDAAAIGIWNWNFVDNSLEWDDRMCEMYAVTVTERMAGISYALWRSRIHPDDLMLAEPTQGDLSRAGSQWSGTYRIILPDGAVRYILASSVTQSTPDGAPSLMMGINRDVTDQTHYEQLLQDTNAVLEDHVAARTAELQTAFAELKRANQLKDEFMAMISHELRTPLTGVLSMSEMLEDQVAGPLNDRQASYVKNITHSGERLLAVINGILSYTHLLSGKVQLHAEPCELGHLLTICAVSQQHKAAAKNQAIAVEVEPPDLAIATDATALAEVLKRLLDNAVKFTPDGGKIGLEAGPGTDPGTVDLVVWDTGIGIPPDQVDHVFHAFTQADARLSRSHEGVGLGLAYSDEMVRLMGGTIRLESTPGEGSRFTITLPAHLHT